MAKSSGKIRVGIGGWKFAPWRETFYPDGLTQKNELEYASRHMTAIEVNSTFYAAQKPATYAKWRSETPEGFVFSLKAPGLITQVRDLALAKRGIQAFVFGGLSELGDRLGPISWQFPPNRGFDAGDFAAFLDLLPADLDGKPLRHVLEVRHESFANDEYVQLVRERKLPTVYTDSPDYPSIADITGNFVYARLMRSRSTIKTGYTKSELDRWAEHARTWAAGHAPDGLTYVTSPSPAARKRDVFIYFISAAKERNPAAAMALRERVER
ncbi:MAG TPA: DUF72 domain-containing protein [Rudaea sp.]|jgi:uncharacterized protein YecE (DUF72 family)|nr:DUF72 domain-containing protein [Rudaea sp.]